MQTCATGQGRQAREGRMNVIRPSPALAAAKALLDAAQLPTSDLTDAHCEHFFYAGPASAPTGLVGLELFGDVALLRSLVVSPEARSSGVGSALVQCAETHAHSRGVRVLYLLTTTAEGYFSRRGYSRAEREQAPHPIRSSREFSGLCPSSSAFMSKQLQEGR
jgi:amino-acid N-acetyltransferase